MLRKAVGMAVVGTLVFSALAFAEPAQRPRRSNTKRIVWTLVGAGLGYTAGLMWGLYKFDDAINSDRKVHTSAILGAAGGALAGNLLSRTIGGAPMRWSARPDRELADARVKHMPPCPSVGVNLAPPCPSVGMAHAPPLGADSDGALRRRVRAANSW